VALITPTNVLAYADHLGAIWDALKANQGSQLSGAAAGNLQQLVALFGSLVDTTLADLQQDVDLAPDALDLTLYRASADQAARFMLTRVVKALEAHLAGQGGTVDGSISGLETYLAYYNGGLGGALFANMVTPSFNDLWNAVYGDQTALTVVNYLAGSNDGTAAATSTPCLTPGINPQNGQASGMGYATAAGSFVGGQLAVTQSGTAGQKSYAEAALIGVVSAGFANGTAAPTVVATGTDHLGNLNQTWTGTLGSNNPAQALPGITITPAVSAQARQTVALSSVLNIVAGSLLTINSGLADQETVLVEAVVASTITAVFLKAHSAGAAVTGSTTIALVNASGRRCRSLNASLGVVLGITGHNAGAVMVCAREDRKSI